MPRRNRVPDYDHLLYARPAGSFLRELRLLARQVHRLERAVQNLQGFEAPTPRGTYKVTNLVRDRTYNANATTVAELADVLGTLIEDLSLAGLVRMDNVP